MTMTTDQAASLTDPTVQEGALTIHEQHLGPEKARRYAEAREQGYLIWRPKDGEELLETYERWCQVAGQPFVRVRPRRTWAGFEWDMDHTLFRFPMDDLGPVIERVLQRRRPRKDLGERGPSRVHLPTILLAVVPALVAQLRHLAGITNTTS